MVQLYPLVLIHTYISGHKELGLTVPKYHAGFFK